MSYISSLLLFSGNDSSPFILSKFSLLLFVSVFTAICVLVASNSLVFAYIGGINMPDDVAFFTFFLLMPFFAGLFFVAFKFCLLFLLSLFLFIDVLSVGIAVLFRGFMLSLFLIGVLLLPLTVFMLVLGVVCSMLFWFDTIRVCDCEPVNRYPAPNDNNSAADAAIAYIMFLFCLNLLLFNLFSILFQTNPGGFSE